MTIQRKLHDWTEADDARLAQAVTDLDPLREQYSERGVKVDEYWSAVAGRMAPEVLVTGRACQARWHDLETRRKELEARLDAPPPVDAWAQVAARVEVYERELGEATYDEVRSVGERLANLEAMVGNNADSGQVEQLRSEVASFEAKAARIEAKLDRLLAELGVKS
jgi:hypothetical protein